MAKRQVGVLQVSSECDRGRAARRGPFRPRVRERRQAVQLLRDGIPGTRITAFDHLEIRSGGGARAAARELMSNAIGGAAHRPIVGFYTGATGEKRFPRQRWREWVEGIRCSRNPPRLLRIVPPGTEGGELPHVGVVAVSDLDRLGALIGRLDLIVRADSGPMHLAAAAGTPTIGLFRATSPQDYAPLGPHCIPLGPADTSGPRRRRIHAGAPSPRSGGVRRPT